MISRRRLLAARAIEAARKKTSTIPIVFVAAFDPVGNGFAQSLARPGLNLTGVSNNVPNIAPRQLELVRLAVPHAERIAVVLNHRNRATAQARREYEAAAEKMGIELRVIQAGTAEQLLAAVGAGAHPRRAGAGRAGRRHFLPVARCAGRHAGRAEAARAFHPGAERRSRRADELRPGHLRELPPRRLYYVDRLLKGAKAAELPIEPPTKIELTINLKAARALGLTLPPALVKQAARILK